VAGLQVCPLLQQAEQPQSVSLPVHRATQLWFTQIWPQPQAGLQVCETHLPLSQVSFAGQLPILHVPLQPSLAPQAAPAQSGVQQLLLTHTSPVAQGQALPQPSAAHEPVVQTGVQQLMLLLAPAQNSPLGQPVQGVPQPSSWPHTLPVQEGAQHEPLTHTSPEAHGQLCPQPSVAHEPVVQVGVQQLMLLLDPVQNSPLGQPVQGVPQPLSCPQVLPVQSGVQQFPVTQVWPLAHLQSAPQPFAPHEPAGQTGSQTHLPRMQLPASHGPAQHVSMQLPLLQR
jgi:hypothetical protein